MAYKLLDVNRLKAVLYDMGNIANILLNCKGKVTFQNHIKIFK